MAGSRRAVKVGSRTVELTHEDKIIFPESKITKAEFIDYYRRIAPVMIPYMKDRPISMLRYVTDIRHEGFYQKEAGSYFPSWIKTKTIKKEGGSTRYVVCNDAATLVYLANQLCITPHLWLSKIDKLNKPDRLIFDLDPSGKDFGRVMATAKMLRKLLESKGITPFVMTTGSRGLHVVVPLKRVHTFDFVRAWAQTVARELIEQDPKHLTLEVRKNKRRGRIFIDTLRNAFGQTGVAPYAVRAHPKAPVATPLEWSELTSRLTSQRYTIKTIAKRLSQRGDPWKDIDKHATTLR